MRPLLAVVLALTLAACSSSPTGRKQLTFFPPEQLDQMGVAAFQEMKQQMPVEASTQVNRYVECVADAITRQLPAKQEWEVTVFEDASANAFALPGGKIGVHTGLLEVAKSPDQLAAVIGHEVAHVVARHANERVSTAFATNAGLQLIAAVSDAGESPQKQALMGLLGLGAQVGVILPFSRTQEAEADQVGLELMAKAGFDPRAAVALWENMAKAGGAQPPAFLSTHPAHGSRTKHLREHMPEAVALYEQARARGIRPNCS